LRPVHGSIALKSAGPETRKARDSLQSPAILVSRTIDEWRLLRYHRRSTDQSRGWGCPFRDRHGTWQGSECPHTHPFQYRSLNRPWRTRLHRHRPRPPERVSAIRKAWFPPRWRQWLAAGGNGLP
jgi:hypothetical protein